LSLPPSLLEVGDVLPQRESGGTAKLLPLVIWTVRKTSGAERGYVIPVFF